MNPENPSEPHTVQDGATEKTADDDGATRLRLALAAGGLGTWQFDFRAGIGTASARTWEIFGLPGRETLEIEEWTARIHPDDREAARLEFERASQTGVFRLDYRVLRPDGEVRWVAVTGSLERDAHGTPVSLDGVIEDISERKRAEAALRENELRQTFLLQLSDTLRPLLDAVEIQAAVTRTVMDFFGSDRCYYCEVLEGEAIIRRDASREGLPSVVGTYPLSNYLLFQAMMGTGKPLVVEDSHSTDLMDEDLRQLCVQMEIISFINVPVIKEGQYAGNLCITQRLPRKWTALEIRLAEETAERTWAAVERARAEAALIQSEEKYRNLFDSTDQGITSAEMIFDEAGKVVDYWLVESNKAMERLTGLPPSISGKRAREILPDLQEAWFETWERVVKTGVPERVELEVAALGRWFDLHFSRIGGEGSRRAVAVYTNITERKRREASLAFLAEVSQDLVHLTNVDETMDALGAKIGAYFKVSRVNFANIHEAADEARITHEWHREGLIGTAGDKVYRLQDFISEAFYRSARAGEIIVVRDTRTDPRTDDAAYVQLTTRSFITAPFVRQGQWQFLMSIADTEPRDWREDEIELMRDITERVWIRLERARAEEAWRESEERLRLALESGQMGAWDWDLTTDVQHWSPEMSAIFGVPHLPTRPVTDFFSLVHPDDLPGIRSRAEQAASSGLNDVLDEFRIVRPDGTESWVASRSRFQRDANGRPVRMAGVNLDITERKRAEAALEESQERFRLLAEHTSDVYWLTDYPARRPLYISPAYQAILGLPTDEPLESDGWAQAIHPDDGERVAHAFAEKALEGAFDEEYRVLRHDGAVRWIRDRAFPIRDAAGVVYRIAGVAQDITERRLLEDRLREINQAQRRFIADAAHELRAPLMAMSGNLELLRAHAPDDPDSVEMIHDLHHETQRLTRLVNDLLTVARSDSGTPMQREPVALERVLLDAWRLALALPDGHHLQLGTLEPCVVMGDASRLQQLALALLENAVKYTQSGGTIRLELRHHPDRAEFRVTDTGPGIPATDLERVFERFYRGDKARTRGADPGGTGLGLPIARLIAEQHGGRVWLESQVGHGTTAVVQLPCVPEPHPDERQA